MVLIFVGLGCNFEYKTGSNTPSENKTTNNSSISEPAKTNSNSVSNENKQPLNTEKPKVETKSDSPTNKTKVEEKNLESEDAENYEGDDENGREIVKFGKGKTSATYEYGLVRGERRTYVVEARKGQTMAVRVEAEEKNAVFTITKNGKIVDTAEETEKWVGTLPSDGKYEIEVGGTRGNASYIIEISVEN